MLAGMPAQSKKKNALKKNLSIFHPFFIPQKQ
jgi:hypothetical protein